MERIPMEYRDFPPTRLEERADLAKKFVEEFVLSVAPSKNVDDFNADWTTAVRKRFDDIRPKDLELIPRKLDKLKEYLVDFAWLEQSEGHRMIFACECEWASADYGRHTWWGLVEEDFEKLLAVKAPFKVLIFSSTLEDKRTSPDPQVDFTLATAKERLATSLTNYEHHLAGETYIFIDFPATGKKGGNGSYEAFIWVAEQCGKANVQFENLLPGVLNRPDQAAS